LRERTQVKTIEVNGTGLHYVERGEGLPVVFVHGGLGDFRTWLPQVEAFSAHYRAISYSRRAHYPNAWPPDYTLSRMLLHVEDLAAFIEGLGLGRTHVVGNSYGSYISLHLALEYPHLVHGLALAEPPVHPLLRSLPGGEEMFEDFMRDAWGPAGEAFGRGDLEGGTRLFVAGAVGPGQWDKLSPRVREAMLKDAPELAVATHTPFETHMPPLACDDLARIEAPVLLLRGEHSPRMYALINDELARCLPRAEQATVPGASHVLHAHNQEAHDRLVLGFLAGC
jgi:pimeloyl-ACP methyl ester carboxylesterase